MPGPLLLQQAGPGWGSNRLLGEAAGLVSVATISLVTEGAGLRSLECRAWGWRGAECVCVMVRARESEAGQRPLGNLEGQGIGKQGHHSHPSAGGQSASQEVPLTCRQEPRGRAVRPVLGANHLLCSAPCSAPLRGEKLAFKGTSSLWKVLPRCWCRS